MHEMVERAIMASSIDMRKTLSRNIYLSGGTTMLPGFADRLETELQYILPAACAVKVHASPYRLHAAFQGASVLAGLPNFSSLCVWSEDWHEVGPDVLGKFDEDNVAPDYDDDDSDDEVVGYSGGSSALPVGAERVYFKGSDDESDGDDEGEDDDDEEKGDGAGEGDPDGGIAPRPRQAFSSVTEASAGHGGSDDEFGADGDADTAAFDEPEEMSSYI